MKIDVLPGAVGDIKALRQSDPRALAVVMTMIQEAEADPMMATLLAEGGDDWVGRHRVNVKPWVKARARGDNLHRVRILDTPATDYRVVLGHDWRSQRVGLLAIAHKDAFDYEPDSVLGRRIRADWRNATGGQPT